MNEVNMAVLGVGRMGQVHCRYIRETPGLKLVAASSRAATLTLAVSQRYGIRVYRAHEDLLADPEVQWVVIANTSDQHKHWALAALEAGKNLIIEKPIALSLADAIVILQTAEEQGLQVAVHNSRRWDEDFKLVQGVLNQGELGEVYRIESRYTDCSAGWGSWGSQGEANPWRLKKRQGGGLLNDWGPHLFDQLLQLGLGRVRKLYGKTYSKVWGLEVEDHFWAELSFEGGFSARAEASNNHRISLPRWLILGSQGTLAVSGGDPADWNTAIVKVQKDGRLEERRLDISHPELSKGFYDSFSRALRDGSPLPVTPEQILQVMRLVEAVRQSQDRGEVIDVS
jgi:scyllo-inositol 2-dehydrogenase (NADP+)